MTVATSLRRTPTKLSECDSELRSLAISIRRRAGEERERFLLDADRLLDLRLEIMQRTQAPRGLK